MQAQTCTLPASPFAGSVSFPCLSPSLQTDISAVSAYGSPVWELIFADCDRLFMNGERHSPILFRNELFIHEIPAREALCKATSLQMPKTGAIALRFFCSSPLLCLLTYLPLRTSKIERILFARILWEAASSPDSGAARCMEAFLDRLLVRFCAYGAAMSPHCLFFLNMDGMGGQLFPLLQGTHPGLLYLSVLQYLKSHLHTSLSVAQICTDNRTSRSRLEELFRRMGWHGVMDCFSRLKINAAGRMIASGSMSFTQIAASLGFSSVFYFSRRFREITKMTPTEYASLCRKRPVNSTLPLSPHSP